MGEVGVPLGLGEDEGALQHGLSVAGEADRGPIRFDPVAEDRRLDVGDEGVGMAENAVGAGLPDRIRGGVGFLRHGADEAGEFGHRAIGDQGAAEVDIGEDAIERVLVVVIGGGGEEGGGGRRPVFGRGYAEGLFRWEVVEERALGDACFPTQLIDACGGEALTADDGDGGLEKARAGVGAGGGGIGHAMDVPTGRYVRKAIRRERLVIRRVVAIALAFGFPLR